MSETPRPVRIDAGAGKAFLGSRPLRLGRRLPVVPDERDLLHTYAKPRGARSLLASATYKYWYDLTWRGDQGNTPQCVAYSALHRLENSPFTRPTPGPVVTPGAYYKRAQQLDEWPGEDYEGSSVRAGAKVAREKGYIDEYQWIDTAVTTSPLADMITAVLTRGPAVVGTVWFMSMFEPVSVACADGVYRPCLEIDESQGGIAGGHAWLVNGVNLTSRTFRMLNSWGPMWGKDGHAWVSFETMERLVFGEEGECCVYREVA